MKFVDTNIFIYSILANQDPSKHLKAVAILSGENVSISSQIVNEFASVLRSKAKIGDDELKLLIEDLYSRFEVLDVTRDDIISACDLRKEYSLSYWDSTVIACALRSKATELISEDLQHGLVIRKVLTIINPFRQN